MGGGMGEEEVYKVTLMEDKTAEETAAEHSKTAVPEAAMPEEETAECDLDDPFAMMGGMGEEEVYKVTLMEDKAAEEAAVESKEIAVLQGARQTEENMAH